jgi:hypothetical protein
VTLFSIHTRALIFANFFQAKAEEDQLLIIGADEKLGAWYEAGRRMHACTAPHARASAHTHTHKHTSTHTHGRGALTHARPTDRMPACPHAHRNPQSGVPMRTSGDTWPVWTGRNSLKSVTYFV